MIKSGMKKGQARTSLVFNMAFIGEIEAIRDQFEPDMGLGEYIEKYVRDMEKQIDALEKELNTLRRKK